MKLFYTLCLTNESLICKKKTLRQVNRQLKKPLNSYVSDPSNLVQDIFANLNKLNKT